MSSLTRSRKTVTAQGLLRWKRCFWNVPFRTLLTASEEEQNVAATVVGELVDARGGVVQPVWESDDESTSSEHCTLERV
jgi:hypothetical protein